MYGSAAAARCARRARFSTVKALATSASRSSSASQPSGEASGVAEMTVAREVGTGSGSASDVGRGRPPLSAPLRRAERGQHQHRLDERVGGWADQVAPVGRAEQEAELELDEAEGAVAVAG